MREREKVKDIQRACMHTQTTEILYNYSFIFKQAIGLQINDTTLRFYDYCEHYQSISRTNEVSRFQRVGVHDITLHHHGITILKTLIILIILITDVTLTEKFLFTTRMHLNLPVTCTPQIYLLIPFPSKVLPFFNLSHNHNSLGKRLCA